MGKYNKGIGTKFRSKKDQDDFITTLGKIEKNLIHPFSFEFKSLMTKGNKNFLFFTHGTSAPIRYWETKNIFCLGLISEDLPFPLWHYLNYAYDGNVFVSLHVDAPTYQYLCQFLNASKWDTLKPKQFLELVYELYEKSDSSILEYIISSSIPLPTIPPVIQIIDSIPTLPPSIFTTFIPPILESDSNASLFSEVLVESSSSIFSKISEPDDSSSILSPIKEPNSTSEISLSSSIMGKISEPESEQSSVFDIISEPNSSSSSMQSSVFPFSSLEEPGSDFSEESSAFVQAKKAQEHFRKLVPYSSSSTNSETEILLEPSLSFEGENSFSSTSFQQISDNQSIESFGNTLKSTNDNKIQGSLNHQSKNNNNNTSNSNSKISTLSSKKKRKTTTHNGSRSTKSIESHNSNSISTAHFLNLTTDSLSFSTNEFEQFPDVPDVFSTISTSGTESSKISVHSRSISKSRGKFTNHSKKSHKNSDKKKQTSQISEVSLFSDISEDKIQTLPLEEIEMDLAQKQPTLNHSRSLATFSKFQPSKTKSNDSSKKSSTNTEVQDTFSTSSTQKSIISINSRASHKKKNKKKKSITTKSEIKKFKDKDSTIISNNKTFSSSISSNAKSKVSLKLQADYVKKKDSIFSMSTIDNSINTQDLHN